tara:strand:- start:12159 stop:13028 length:870 start_codon:yes stop_codon:yes gene_type:complete
MNNLKSILLLIILIPFIGFSQYKKGKGNGLYGTGGDAVDQGWFLGLGLTYMMPYSQYSDKISATDSLTNVTTTTNYLAQPKNSFGKSFTSQLAPMLEIGKFKMNNKKFINYMDYSLSWKWFRGGENYTETTNFNNIETNRIESRANYSDHLVSGNFNLGYRFDKNDDLFYVNGLGLNLDYHFIKSRGVNKKIPDNENYTDGPASLLGELHYFFGIGFKTKGRLIIMPMIETPILALLPFNHIKSAHVYNNTRHRPFLIKVRFMFLRQGSKSCPAVYDPQGIDPNGNRSK